MSKGKSLGRNKVEPTPQFTDNQFVVTFTTTAASEIANLWLGSCAAGTVINWGDGTADEPLGTGTGISARPHTYVAAGSYQAVLTGSFLRIGSSSQSIVQMNPLVSVDHWGSALGVIDTSNAFNKCEKLTSVAPPPAGVTAMTQMFTGAKIFNSDVSGWDTSQITTMSYVFNNAAAFTGIGISAWDTSKVTNMQSMFKGALVFNGDVSGWDTSQVTTMSNMFENTSFNGDLSQWDTSKAAQMGSMFRSSAFTGDVSRWDTSKVVNMTYMFYTAAFGATNPDLTPWPVPLLPTKPTSFTDVSEAVWPLERQPQWGTMGVHVPAVPANVAVKSSEPAALVVSWDSVTDATDYKIRIDGGDPIDA